MDNKISFIENDKFGFKTILLVAGGLLFTMRGILGILLFCIAISMYFKKLFKLNLTFFRIVRPKLDLVWIFISLFLPICVIAFYLFFLDGTISFGNKSSIVSSIIFAFIFALASGITEELFFRGYIMKIIEYRWNKIVAIIVPSIIFASLHAFKGMYVWDFLQLLVAGTIVGVMFSLIVYHGDNIWNAVIVHIMWNFLVCGIFNISTSAHLRAIINYRFESDNVVFTGGLFGIEAGIPAIIGYLIVIIYTIIRIIKKPVDLMELEASVNNSV